MSLLEYSDDLIPLRRGFDAAKARLRLGHESPEPREVSNHSAEEEGVVREALNLDRE